ncbi:hypothetical protein INR49_012726 [Caranx melampygus]|nr:hypothetical protein INR49_012726 [Caranx melampygus]
MKQGYGLATVCGKEVETSGSESTNNNLKERTLSSLEMCAGRRAAPLSRCVLLCMCSGFVRQSAVTSTAASAVVGLSAELNHCSFITVAAALNGAVCTHGHVVHGSPPNLMFLAWERKEVDCSLLSLNTDTLLIFTDAHWGDRFSTSHTPADLHIHINISTCTSQHICSTPSQPPKVDPLGCTEREPGPDHNAPIVAGLLALGPGNSQNKNRLPCQYLKLVGPCSKFSSERKAREYYFIVSQVIEFLPLTHRRQGASWGSFFTHIARSEAAAAGAARISSLHIAAYFSGGFVCVSQSHPVLSFTPKKQKYSLFILLFLSLSTPPSPISLLLQLALIRPCSHTGKMTARGKRERRGRERGEKEMTATQQVWSIREEREREKRGECYSDDELLAMGGGGDICSIKRHPSWSISRLFADCQTMSSPTEGVTARNRKVVNYSQFNESDDADEEYGDDKPKKVRTAPREPKHKRSKNSQDDSEDSDDKLSKSKNDSADDFGSDDEDNDFGEEEDEDGGSDYEEKRGKKGKKAKVEKPSKRGPKRKRAADDSDDDREVSRKRTVRQAASKAVSKQREILLGDGGSEDEEHEDQEESYLDPDESGSDEDFMVEDDDDSDYGHSKKRSKKVIRRGRTDKKEKKSPKPRLKATVTPSPMKGKGKGRPIVLAM